jgi:ABC-type transport system substrate-binding protein
MQVVTGQGANVDYLGVNLTSASLLSIKLVRQAVAYAIDREVIIHRLLRDQARRADAVMPPEHWAFYSGVTVYTYDPERAARLLDEAGFLDPDGDGPQPRLKLSLMTTTVQLSRNIAAILQEQLRRVGVQLDLESLEFATLLDRVTKGQFDLYYLRSIGANQSPDIFQFVYHSRYQNPEFNDIIAKLRGATDTRTTGPLLDQLASILGTRSDYCPNPEVTRLINRAASLNSTWEADTRRRLYLQIAGLLTDRGGQNRMRYCNPEVDGWIVEAERANDRATKLELYSKIQKTVSDELPQIYLWYPANVLVARARVGNIQIEPTGSWFFIAKLTLDDR